nr:META domain-containing protein [Jannaschia sp. S6380]
MPFLVLGLALAACQRDETISGYVDPETIWQLKELNGQPFPATATLTFPRMGEVAGNGPCNAFRANQSAPLPWIDMDGITATRRTCADLAAETRFLDALRVMTLAEVAGDTLLLSNDAMEEMVFRAR